MRKLTIFIIVLAVVVGIIGFYYYQRNVYSKEVLKLEILGPEETELLQEIEYVVKYKNNGNVVYLDQHVDQERRLFFIHPAQVRASHGFCCLDGKPAPEDGQSGKDLALSQKTHLALGRVDVHVDLIRW